MEQFARDSFNATISFALLALGLLVICALVLGNDVAMACGLLACATAYAAQLFATFNAQCVAFGSFPNTPVAVAAVAFNLFAIGFWIVGLCVLV